MLHHIVILQVEPCSVFSPPSLFSYFYFLKKNSFATLGYKNIEAQNLTTNVKNLNKYRV